MLTQHGSPCWPHGLGPQDGILHKLTPGRRAQVGAYELGPGPTSSGRGVREGLLIDYLMLGALLAHVPTSGGPVALSAVQATLMAPGGLYFTKPPQPAAKVGAKVSSLMRECAARLRTGVAATAVVEYFPHGSQYRQSPACIRTNREGARALRAYIVGIRSAMERDHAPGMRARYRDNGDSHAPGVDGWYRDPSRRSKAESELNELRAARRKVSSRHARPASASGHQTRAGAGGPRAAGGGAAAAVPPPPWQPTAHDPYPKRTAARPTVGEEDGVLEIDDDDGLLDDEFF